MKKITLLFLSTALASQAALIPLGLSPAGSDYAVGLSPANEVPPVAGTGSGGPVTNAAVFDSDSHTLHLSAGYGSAAGFTDLTGAAIGFGICGPAQTNQTAPPLYNLAALSFPAANPATGGAISGDVLYATNDVAGLLAGLHYLNISTSNNPNGEIRGQLIPLDIPPQLTCPTNTTADCGSPVTFTVEVFDPVGNSVTNVWSLNGVAVQTNMVPAFTPPAATNVTFTATLPAGTNTLQIDVVNAAGSSASCSNTITVVDTNPPAITSATASPSVLWPPNHKMVKVKVSAQVADTCSATTWQITGVESSEAVDAPGSGNTAPDWQILSGNTVNLRAERSGNGPGRTYTITLQATDAAGNVSSNKTVVVTVPHDKGKGKGNSKGNGNSNTNGNGHGRGHGQ